MTLPASDTAYLAARAIEHHVTIEAGMICVVIPKYQLPPGLSVEQADLLLRLNPGFPDVPPDMWWFDPPVLRADGAALAATQVTETHVGRSWQRWSRHLNAGQWRPGIDGLESYLALLRLELQRSALKAA